MKKLDTILLVDDDDTTNFINELLIKKMGVAERLLIAKNGEEALQLIEDNCEHDGKAALQVPNLILLDINMPVLDGFGFLKAFDAMDCPEKEGAVIVVLTTSLNPIDLDRIKSSGVRAFINKPLTKEKLSELLTTYVA